MSEKIISRLKQLQSDVKTHKRLPEPVIDAQKEVQYINQFVKNFLKKENEVVLSNEAQVHVIQGLAEINRLFASLHHNCRSDEHFQLYKDQFYQMRDAIKNLTFCVNLAIENGFYEVEPRGLGLVESAKVCWQRIQDICGRFTDLKGGSYLSFTLLHNEQFRKEVKELYEVIAPLAEAVLRLKKSDGLIAHLSLEELKIVNRYFRQVKTFQKTVEKHQFDRASSKKILETIKINKPEQILHELNELELTIHRYLSRTESLILLDSIHFDEATTNDLLSRLNSTYIELESSRILSERWYALKTLTTRSSPSAGLQEFSKTISFEKKQLQFFVGNLSRLHQSLIGASSILANLSISFGKIYQLSVKTDFTLPFLARAFETAHNLLSKSVKFAEARKKDSQKIQLALQKATIFQKIGEGVITSALKELEQAKQEIEKYDQKLLGKLKQISEQPALTSSNIQQMLQGVYEERTELSTAAVYFKNICHNFDLIVKELIFVESAYEQIDLDTFTEENAAQLVSQILEYLENYRQLSPEMLKGLWMSVQQMHWFIEDIILASLREDRRFKEELDAYISPVKKRIEIKKIQEKLEETKQAEVKKKVQEVKTAKVVDNPVEKSTPETLASLKSPTDKILPVAKKIKKKPANAFDPFSPESMENLKKACASIGTERILEVLRILERPHAFFDFLEHLEEQYDPESPFTETLWMSEIMESECALDFVLGFLKVKFLPYGYFDANGVAISFDKETKKFQKFRDVDLYLKISNKYLETPKGTLGRLLRILMQYEEVNALNPDENQKLVGLLRMDHIITEEEKEQLHQKVPYVN
ncbi:MAG: hypothetical protein HQM14_02140 [SAR324 cluster bacterium]|nr:hypothetical protein [SAR324 cluster bacterium]